MTTKGKIVLAILLTTIIYISVQRWLKIPKVKVSWVIDTNSVVTILENETHNVYWIPSNEIETNYVSGKHMARPDKFKLGLVDDGTVIWKEFK